MPDLSQLSDEELMRIAGQASQAGMALNGLEPQADKPSMDDLGVPVLGQADIDRLMGVQPSAPDITSMSDEELMAIAAPQQPVAPQPTQMAALQHVFEAKKNPNFFQRVGEDYATRNKSLQQAQNEYIYGDRYLPRTMLRVAGDIAGFAGDVGGEALKSAGTGLNNITFGGAEKVGNIALNSIAASPVGDALRYTAGKYGAFEKAYPEAARDISSAGNVLGAAAAFTPVKGGVSAANLATEKAIVPAGKLAARGTEKAITSLATPKMVMPNSDQLAELGVKSYEAARKSGEVFDPTVTNKFVSAIETAKPQRIGGTVETELSKDLESALGKYKELADRPLSIDEVDIIDKDLGNLKDQAYSAGKNQFAGQLANIQNSLRGSVAESPSGQTLAQARDMFRRKYQMEDVERIFRNAEGRPNEAAIIQTGYRNLANQARKKGSGYTKEQIAIMDKAAKGGLSIDALKLASSRLIPIAAGAAGGPVGAVGSYMGNVAAAAGATALQTAKANKLAKSITKGLTVPAEPTAVNRLASKLKKEDIQQAFEAKKAEPKQLLLPSPTSARPMSERQIKAAQAYIKNNKGKSFKASSSYDYGDVPYNVINLRNVSDEVPFPDTPSKTGLDAVIASAMQNNKAVSSDAPKLTSFLKNRGGIKSNSDFSSQDLGAGKKGTAVGLFRKDGKGIDNIPANELRAAGFDDVIEDGNGYASSDWVFEKIRNESGKQQSGIYSDRKMDMLQSEFDKMKKGFKPSDVKNTIIQDTKKQVKNDFGADITDIEAESLYLRVLDGEDYDDVLTDILERGS